MSDIISGIYVAIASVVIGLITVLREPLAQLVKAWVERKTKEQKSNLDLYVRQETELNYWRGQVDPLRDRVKHLEDADDIKTGQIEELAKLDKAKAEKIEALERWKRQYRDLIRNLADGVNVLIGQLVEAQIEPRYRPPNLDELDREGE